MESKTYITNTGWIVRVRNSIHTGMWSTWVFGADRPCEPLHRLPSADTPDRETYEEAQADLDKLAARCGWEMV